MISSRKIIEQGNKKIHEENEALLHNKYGALLQAAKKQKNIADEIKANFTKIHDELIKASVDASLLKSMLDSINEICDDFKNQILHNEVNQDGLMKVVSLKNAIDSTFDSNVSSENKLKAITTFESMSQSSLYRADQDKKRKFWVGSSIALVLTGVLLGLAITSIIVATGGVAAACLIMGAVAGMGLEIGLTLGLAKSLDMPSSLGSKLKKTSQHGIFASKTISMRKENITQMHQYTKFARVF